MTKPYTWGEVKKLLSKDLAKTKHILTFGTIGSCDVEHDIEVIITKKPNSRSSDFYKEVHSLFDNVDKYLYGKYNSRAICISADEKSLKHIFDFGKNDLFFDLMVYMSYPQIENDWKWAMFPDENMDDLLFNKYDLLIGENKSLKSEEFNKKNYGDSIFLYLYHGDIINSHLPNKLFLKLMNSLFDYLMRKRLKVKPLKAKTEKEVREIFYKICDLVDNLNNKTPR